ncbi:hypothetical protein OAU50_04075 [Planctomycetota bacterium]|nr:hypothetical protein [Planctomycetota bacterium]
MMSLEPPKRRTGPQLGKAKTRMDGMGGPSTISGRNRSLMGNIGREKTQSIPKNQPNRGPGRPTDQSGQAGVKRTNTGPVSMGGASQEDMDTMIMRRKGTSRIPKKGGGMQGVSPALDSMGSGRRAPVQPNQPQPPLQNRQIDPAARQNLPPVINVPIPTAQPIRDAGNAPPPPASRGNTLAGVSAEDLLGAEGRQVLENMRQRASHEDVDTREVPALQEPGLPPQQQNLAPRSMDSSRMAFSTAEYTDETLAEQQKSDELNPQGDFMRGPTRQIKRDVLQTPMPAEEQAAPTDDLGYERPVDFGESDGGSDEADPKARESAAYNEVEQRAGYLLWLQGVITREEVEDALSVGDVPEPVRELLAESGFADQETLYRFLARHEALANIDFGQCPPNEEALAELRPSIARSYRVVPVCKLGDILMVAASFPFDPQRLLELRRMTSSKIKLFVATDDEIESALQTYYPSRATSTIEKPQDSDASGEELEAVYDPTLGGEESGLYSALSGNASDVPESSESGVAMAEVDEAEESHYENEEPKAPEAADTLRDDPIPDDAIGDDADLDESTLDGADDSGLGLTEDDEIDLDGGPEDHDPFA